jgi:hypothetical protein
MCVDPSPGTVVQSSSFLYLLFPIPTHSNFPALGKKTYHRVSYAIKASMVFGAGVTLAPSLRMYPSSWAEEEALLQHDFYNFHNQGRAAGKERQVAETFSRRLGRGQPGGHTTRTIAKRLPSRQTKGRMHMSFPAYSVKLCFATLLSVQINCHHRLDETEKTGVESR